MDSSKEVDRQAAVQIFHQVLADAAPPEPAGVLEEVHRRGARLRLRRRAGTALVSAVVAAAVTGAVLTTETSGRPQAGAPGLAANSATPQPAPNDLHPSALTIIHDRLKAALAAHLPAGVVRVSDGNGPTDFTLMRADGSTVEVGAVTGRQSLVSRRSPCVSAPNARELTGCNAVFLPDGSSGWLYQSRDKHMTELDATTVQGWTIGLSSNDFSSSHPGGPLSLGQLHSLVSTPQVLAALKTVPTDAAGG